MQGQRFAILITCLLTLLVACSDDKGETSQTLDADSYSGNLHVALIPSDRNQGSYELLVSSPKNLDRVLMCLGTCKSSMAWVSLISVGDAADDDKRWFANPTPIKPTLGQSLRLLAYRPEGGSPAETRMLRFRLKNPDFTPVSSSSNLPQVKILGLQDGDTIIVNGRGEASLVIADKDLSYSYAQLKLNAVEQADSGNWWPVTLGKSQQLRIPNIPKGFFAAQLVLYDAEKKPVATTTFTKIGIGERYVVAGDELALACDKNNCPVAPYWQSLAEAATRQLQYPVRIDVLAKAGSSFADWMTRDRNLWRPENQGMATHYVWVFGASERSNAASNFAQLWRQNRDDSSLQGASLWLSKTAPCPRQDDETPAADALTQVQQSAIREGSKAAASYLSLTGTQLKRMENGWCAPSAAGLSELESRWKAALFDKIPN